MESEEETMRLTRRTSWATQHWGRFFSEMPLKMAVAPSLQDSTTTTARPAETSSGNAAVGISVTDNFHFDELRKELGYPPASQ
jgi:hypothetical protein